MDDDQGTRRRRGSVVLVIVAAVVAVVVGIVIGDQLSSDRDRPDTSPRPFDAEPAAAACSTLRAESFPDLTRAELFGADSADVYEAERQRAEDALSNLAEALDRFEGDAIAAGLGTGEIRGAVAVATDAIDLALAQLDDDPATAAVTARAVDGQLTAIDGAATDLGLDRCL